LKYDDHSAQQLIQKLSHAGREPHPDLINAIWERQAETEPLLLAIFHESFADDWPSDDDPRWYRLPHAGQFLLAWQNEAALPGFVRLYSSDDGGLLDLCEWFEEDLLHYGPTAIPYLGEILVANSNNPKEWHYGKALAGSTLVKIAIYYPETREEVASIIRSQLPTIEAIPTLTEDDASEMWSSYAADLAELADEGSREQILALVEADLLYDDFFDRQNYLRDMNRGFEPQNPPKPYDLRKDYKDRYEWEQARQKRLEREQAKERTQSIRAAQPRTGPKIGRNDPCPCGSGKKYKKCHGRPGS
jgi:hypothetical protein